MGITKKLVMPVELDYICDECGKAPMRPTGQGTAENPPKHIHMCANCRATKDFEQNIRWPRIEFEPLPENPEEFQKINPPKVEE